MSSRSSCLIVPDLPALHGGHRLSRRQVLGLSVSTGLAATCAGCDRTDGADADHSPFVSIKDGHFVRDGNPWRFAGTNCYYLQESSHQVIDSILEDAMAMGLAVIRCWAFSDGTGRPAALQPVPYSYPEEAFDSLDYTVFRAGQNGLKLVFPLTNNWPDYGGMQQYVTWFLGLPDDSYAGSTNHDIFYTNSSIRACFLSYVEHVLKRTNRYNATRYIDDPTIMTWELANEPRNRSDKSGRQLYNWADEVSNHIKKIAPHQLVAIGDEGLGLEPARTTEDPYSAYEGNRWLDISALASVDYATLHLYPQSWKQARSFGVDPVMWGRKWITNHVAESRKLGKPVVLEEFGLHINATDGIPTALSRDIAYKEWLSEAEKSAIAGTQFWMLSGRTGGHTTHVNDDGYQVIYPSSTATIISNHARKMMVTP